MRILVLEHDKALAQTYKEFFEACNHTCSLASDRRSAFLLLSTQRFDTLLADLPMGGFDYGDLLNLIQNYKGSEKIRVFVVRPTEFSTDTYAILKQIGIAGFFTKSITVDLLQKIFSKDGDAMELKEDKLKNYLSKKTGVKNSSRDIMTD